MENFLQQETDKNIDREIVREGTVKRTQNKESEKDLEIGNLQRCEVINWQHSTFVSWTNELKGEASLKIWSAAKQVLIRTIVSLFRPETCDLGMERF